MHKITRHLICDTCGKSVTFIPQSRESLSESAAKLGWQQEHDGRPNHPAKHYCQDCQSIKIKSIKLEFSTDFTEEERKRILAIMAEELKKSVPGIVLK